mmetsp:Transcript_61336/g.198418  ORF Transcript_61336/g.198418 Transcript_61336/m.198418 type:complete len:305 (-) Transcript_61336:25-939(-)
MSSWTMWWSRIRSGSRRRSWSSAVSTLSRRPRSSTAAPLGPRTRAPGSCPRARPRRRQWRRRRPTACRGPAPRASRPLPTTQVPVYSEGSCAPCVKLGTPWVSMIVTLFLVAARAAGTVLREKLGLSWFGFRPRFPARLAGCGGVHILVLMALVRSPCRPMGNSYRRHNPLHRAPPFYALHPAFLFQYGHDRREKHVSKNTAFPRMHRYRLLFHRRRTVRIQDLLSCALRPSVITFCVKSVHSMGLRPLLRRHTHACAHSLHRGSLCFSLDCRAMCCRFPFEFASVKLHARALLSKLESMRGQT